MVSGQKDKNGAPLMGSQSLAPLPLDGSCLSLGTQKCRCSAVSCFPYPQVKKQLASQGWRPREQREYCGNKCVWRQASPGIIGVMLHKLHCCLTTVVHLSLV